LHPLLTTSTDSYKGGVYQEALSAVTVIDDDDYEINGGFGRVRSAPLAGCLADL
jgi:hypothetical protein